MNKEKIKIAFIISNLGQGGAEKQFISLIFALDVSLFDVTIYLYACQTEPFYKDLESRHDIIYLKNKLINKKAIFKIYEATSKIRNLLIRNKYDIVVSTLFMNNFIVRLAAPRSYNNKIIANVRTSIRLYSKLLLLAERIQIKNSFLVFNNYNTYQEFNNIIPAKFHSRLSVIHNGFDIPEDHLTKCRNIVFGVLGRFSREKNIIQAVRVFQEIEENLPDSRLIIQGHYGNQYEEIVKSILSKNIEIREKNPDTDFFYNSIRIMILPSLFEGCPNVLFEALLRRKICIVSAGANSDNFIENGVNGFVYDGTDTGLSKAILSVVEILDTTVERRIIEEGYQYASRNFSISVMVNKYEQLFLNIYEKNQSRN